MKNMIMKNSLVSMILLAVAAFSAGCNSSSDDSAKSTTEQLDKVKKETKDAAQDMKDYAYAQKSEFVAKMRLQLDGINRDLDQLAAKIDKASDAAKADAQPKLQALRDEASKLNTQLEQAKNASESTWNDVKASFEKGFTQLKQSFDQARQWVSDKIAP